MTMMENIIQYSGFFKIKQEPSSAVSLSASIFSKVDLPLPLRAISAILSPSDM